MKRFREVILVLIIMGVLTPASHLAAAPVLLDFEDLGYSVNVEDSYASFGVHFSNAISLTAVIDLNEYDFSPSSGDMAIGDYLGPLVITFDNPTSDISAYFTYASTLTITAYDVVNTILGTFTTLTSLNLGSSDYISLDSFSGVSKLVIQGTRPDSFIMDDFSFNSAAPVPEPSTLLLFGAGLAGLASAGRRKRLA